MKKRIKASDATHVENLFMKVEVTKYRGKFAASSPTCIGLSAAGYATPALALAAFFHMLGGHYSEKHYNGVA